MRSRRTPLVVILASIAVLAAACSSSSPSGGTVTSAPASAASSASTLAGTAWTLASYADSAGNPVTATTPPQAGALVFGTDGTVTGSTGCNQFQGTYTQQGSALTITPGPTTLVACTGPVALQETAMLQALPEVASFDSGPGLELSDSTGAALLAYTASPSSLAGTSWQATGINNGKQAVVGDSGTAKVTATFGADGTLSGSGGCNTYSATYTTSGESTIAIGPAAATMKACEPQSVMDTEQQYFAALANSTTFQLDANSLTLRDSSGAAQVVFAPVTP
jgi:heat shock protein HslJ